MENKTEFQRIFLIFVNEDAGYGTAQKPAGHVRIEVREGRGKLRVSVQNLLENAKYCYRLYLVDTASGRYDAACMGVLGISRNRAEHDYEFDPANVAGSGHSINDFGIAAVLVEYRDRENPAVICPLAAYRGGKQAWRNSLAERLYIKKPQPEEPDEKEFTSKYEGTLESKYIPVEAEPAFNIAQKFPGDSKEEDIGGTSAALEVVEKESEAASSILMGAAIEAPDENRTEAPDEHENPGYKTDEVQAAADFRSEQPEQPEQPGQADGSVPGLDADCAYLNSNTCAYANAGVADPCGSCVMKARHEAAGDGEATGDIEKLRQEFDNNFERYEPFHVKRSDYSWWKVANPVNLNNILYQNNIKSPLLFNPAVMISHFKYRHLIVGIYSDRAGDEEYLVCGVFGMHMVDRKPFGDMCKWVQTEGTRLKYGAFGYWVVYMDPVTGKILNLK